MTGRLWMAAVITNFRRARGRIRRNAAGAPASVWGRFSTCLLEAGKLKTCSTAFWRLQLQNCAVAGVLFALAGCGPKLEFAEVSGKVTLNKKPVAGVFVQFYPLSDAKEQLPSAIAKTDAQGKYTLTHDGDKPGALVGPNRVVVYWPSRDLRGEDRDGKPLPPPSPAIPVRYTVVTESKLDFEVKAGPPQTFDIRLEN